MATLVLTALLAFLLGGCPTEAGSTHVETVEIAGESFDLELAVTPAQHRRGMAGRKEVAEDEGMLFIFEDARHRSFWMKGCLVPLDIMFLDPAGRIVQTHTMPAPDPDTPDDDLPGYPSRYPAQFAIELQAGMIDRLELSEGDRLNLPLERLKRLAE